MTVERHDTVANALARIIAVTDLTDTGDLTPLLAEAITMGRAALEYRDAEHRRCVLVIGEHLSEAGRWVDQYEQEGGAACHLIHDGDELRIYSPPLTVVILPGADDRDDWPQLRAQIAALGPLTDVIRIPNA